MAYTNPLIAEVQSDISRSQSRGSNMATIQQLLAGLSRSGGGGSSGGPSAAPTGPAPQGRVSGSVDGWITAALRDIGQQDSSALHNAVRILIQHESGGNPNAVNNWDSNARAGHPSKGLAQTIPGTFNAYRDPRLPNNIFDPVANLVAGLRYGTSRYGSITNIPGISAVLRGGAYRGY